MADRKHESEDLQDYEVLDASDTLDGDPGDDPLDRGVVTPDRWSAGLRHALHGDEDSESLDELLEEEEPDVAVDPDDDTEAEAVARDTGIDGGGAAAEEAAVHVVDEDEE